MFYTCEAVGTFCFSCLHGVKRNCIVGEEFNKGQSGSYVVMD